MTSIAERSSELMAEARRVPAVGSCPSIIASARGRTPREHFIGWNDKPFDLFLMKSRGGEFVGRKTHVQFGAADARKCCIVQPHMLLGVLAGLRVCAEGVYVYALPLDEEQHESRTVFEMLEQESNTELSYPFVVLDERRQERRVSSEYWKASEAFVSYLDRDEAMYRELSQKALEGVIGDGGVVFDPACSTGRFLADLKQAYPAIRAIGQDASSSMAQVAREHLEEVYVGDAMQPQMPPGRVDLLVLRFLNFDVVTSQQARVLFQRLSPLVKTGGHVLLIGHTPILLDAAWFEVQRFQVERRVGSWRSGQGLFQYYLLKKQH